MLPEKFIGLHLMMTAFVGLWQRPPCVRRHRLSLRKMSFLLQTCWGKAGMIGYASTNTKLELGATIIRTNQIVPAVARSKPFTGTQFMPLKLKKVSRILLCGTGIWWSRIYRVRPRYLWRILVIETAWRPGSNWRNFMG